MRWTKGKPAAKAPTGIVLLCAFDYGGEVAYATMKARPGFDRFGTPCLQWQYVPGERSSDYAPDRYWELPSTGRTI